MGGGWREGIVREFGMDMCTLLYLKWTTNKDLLYSIWNSAQCYVAAWMGQGFGEEWIHVYVCPLTVQLKTINIVNWLNPDTKLEVKV